MSRPLCRVAEDGAVLTLTLDRPDRRNALDEPLLLELVAALEAAAPPRVLVLTGAGNAFAPAPTSGRSRASPIRRNGAAPSRRTPSASPN